MLDIASTNSGILIPRMTQAERNGISNPATGLVIYQTNNTPGFYYFDGNSWVRLSTQGESLTGSGTATRVAFWSGAGTLSSNANLYWDNTNSKLGIGTSTPMNAKIEIVETGEDSGLWIEESNVGQGIRIIESGNGTGIYITSQDNGSAIISEATGNVTTTSITGYIFNDERISSTQIAKLGVEMSSTGTLAEGSSNIGLRVNVSGGTENYSAIFKGGNVGIGTDTPQGDLHIYSETTGNNWASMIRFTNATTGETNTDGASIGLIGNTLQITNLEADNIQFNTQNLVRWRIGAAGHFRPGTTNTFDIGSDALRVKDYYGIGASYTGNVGIGTSAIPTSRLQVNDGSLRISGQTNSNSENGGMIIFDNSSGLGGGNAKMVVRRYQSQVSLLTDNVIYEDYAVRLSIYTNGTNYYLRLSPKTGYNTWWDCNYPNNLGLQVNCSTVGTFYQLSNDFGVNYYGGSIYQINPNNTLGWPSYIVKVHLHSQRGERIVTAIVESYYP